MNYLIIISYFLTFFLIIYFWEKFYNKNLKYIFEKDYLNLFDIFYIISILTVIFIPIFNFINIFLVFIFQEIIEIKIKNPFKKTPKKQN